MAFEKKIIGSIACPRCNAEARLEVETKPETTRVFVYLICPICRLRAYQYSTSKKGIRLEFKIAALEQKLAEEPDPKKRKRISAIIETMNKLKVRAEFE